MGRRETRRGMSDGRAVEGSASKLGRRTFLSLAAVAAAGGAGVVAKTFWSRRGPASQVAGEARLRVRRLPVAIRPHGELADVVPVDETRELLLTLIPCWNQAAKLPLVLHAFRLWGPRAEFPPKVFTRPFDRPVFTGQMMEGVFSDSRRFQEVYPLDPPILYSYADGVVVRRGSTLGGGDIGRLFHRDSVLRTFGELGYSSKTPLLAVKAAADRESLEDFQQATIEDLVHGSVAYFDPEQEIEWTVEALARYLAPQQSWTNRFGATFSFDDLARKLVRRPLGRGSCRGLHVPYALICLYRINQQHGIVSDSVRRQIEDYFHDRSRGLERKQNRGGMFLEIADPLWKADRKKDPHEDRSKWISTEGLSTLSHHLDWIALAPEGLRPKRDTVARAAEAMLRGLRPWTMYVRSTEYAPLSHAGTSLCGLLGRSPAEIVSQQTTSG